jgi:DeoR/GlpR family transcriptional regulator of sugar metabolism
VADSSKWATQGLVTVVGLEEIDIVITDDALSETDARAAQEQVADLRRVRP